MSPAPAAEQVYQRPEAFLTEVFAGDVPKPAVIWLTAERRERAAELLRHEPAALRVRYWRRDGRTAWILEEIGKEKPITVGIVVADGRIQRVKVLVFRESRGWEVRHPFFTDQFTGAALEGGSLDRPIDGISGATLSVRALRRLARLALYLHGEVVTGS